MASHSGDADSSLLDIAEDFGQRVDLTRRIREILANYPEGTTVLKELIQNADDAGATDVCFCLDRRKHGDNSLLYEELAAWQGPALLAYNNAQFSADDFDSISKLGGSKKQRDPWKTGRFGYSVGDCGRAASDAPCAPLSLLPVCTLLLCCHALHLLLHTLLAAMAVGDSKCGCTI